jgi:hypothetical protein
MPKLWGLFISPPSERPHGFWYVSGPLGCTFGLTLYQALNRYLCREEVDDD